MAGVDAHSALLAAWLVTLSLALAGGAAHLARWRRAQRTLTWLCTTGQDGPVRAAALRRRRGEAYRVVLKGVLLGIAGAWLHRLTAPPPLVLRWEHWVTVGGVLLVVGLLSVWTLHDAVADRQNGNGGVP